MAKEGVSKKEWIYNIKASNLVKESDEQLTKTKSKEEDIEELETLSDALEGLNIGLPQSPQNPIKELTSRLQTYLPNANTFKDEYFQDYAQSYFSLHEYVQSFKGKSHEEILGLLQSHADVQDRFSSISAHEEHIFDETEISNEISETVLSALLKDCPNLDYPRCFGFIPCRETDASGKSNTVVYLAISGRISLDLITQVQDKLKAIKLSDKTGNDIAIRFIPEATETFNWMFHDITSAMDMPVAAEPDKPCCEKKLFSELTKKFASNQDEEKLQLLGFTTTMVENIDAIENKKREKERELSGKKKTLETVKKKLGNIDPSRIPEHKRLEMEIKQEALIKEMQTIKQEILKITEEIGIYKEISRTEINGKTRKNCPLCENCKKQKMAYLAFMLHGANIQLDEKKNKPQSLTVSYNQCRSSSRRHNPLRLSNLRAVTIGGEGASERFGMQL